MTRTRLVALLLLPLVLASFSIIPAVSGSAQGTVCIASGTTATCPSPPVTLTAAKGSTLTVAVNIQGSDSMDGFDVFVLADSTILNAAPVLSSVDLSSSILNALPQFIKVVCINGLLLAGTGCATEDGPGVVHVTYIGFGLLSAPVGGNLFKITYNVVGTTTAIAIGYVSDPVGCAASSSSPFCVTIPNGVGGSAPETLQTATFSNPPPPPPDFTVSATPSSLTVLQGSPSSFTVTVTGVGGFAGSVGVTTTSSPTGLPLSPTTTTVTATASGASFSLTVSPTISTDTTTYTLTITGTGTVSGKSVSHSVSPTPTVTVKPIPKDFSIMASPSSLTVVQAGPTEISDITLTGTNGFTDTVSLALSITGTGGPTVSLNPTSVTLSLSTTSAVASLLVSATSSTNLSSYIVTVNATGLTTGKSHSVIVFVDVVPPSPSPDFTLRANPTALTIRAGEPGSSYVTLQSVNGFSGTLNLTARISPPGPSLSLSRTSVLLASGGFWTVLLTVSTTTSSNVGNYSAIVTGTNGTVSHSLIVPVTVFPASPLPGFTINASPSSLSITQATSAMSTIALTGFNGFSDKITLSAAGPAGLTTSFNPPTVSGSGSSALTISSSSTLANGPYSVNVTGTSGSLSHQVTISVMIIAAPSSDFLLSASPLSATVPRGQTATFTIELDSLGFSGTLTLKATVSCANKHPCNGRHVPTASLSESMITLSTDGRAITTLTISADINTPRRSYNIVVTANSGTMSHSVTLNVSVDR